MNVRCYWNELRAPIVYCSGVTQPTSIGQHLYFAASDLVEKFTNLPFGYYRDMFDTPENRVITSGRTFGSAYISFWVIPPIKDEPVNLANIVNVLCDKPQGN